MPRYDLDSYDYLESYPSRIPDLTSYYPKINISGLSDDMTDFIYTKKEELPDMAVIKEADGRTMSKTCKVNCRNIEDLSPERIFKTLSIMKTKLHIECIPHKINKITCKMTPEVRKNLIYAYRKQCMFGKATPFVARFDEYGRRLEDDVRIETLHGMTIEIVDPTLYGIHYLDFAGVIDATSQFIDSETYIRT